MPHHRLAPPSVPIQAVLCQAACARCLLSGPGRVPAAAGIRPHGSEPGGKTATARPCFHKVRV